MPPLSVQASALAPSHAVPPPAPLSRSRKASSAGLCGAPDALQLMVEDLLEDPISYGPTLRPVLAADGRIYDYKSLENWRKQNSDGLWRSPFTRQVIAAPRPMPQLQALADVVFATEIAAEKRRRAKPIKLAIPPMPALTPCDIGSLTWTQADAVVREQRRAKDNRVDVARIEPAVFNRAGVVDQLSQARRIADALGAAGLVDPVRKHLVGTLDIGRIKQALRADRPAWKRHLGVGELSTVQLKKLVSCVALVASEARRVAALEHTLACVSKVLKQAQTLRQAPAIEALTARRAEIIRQTLKMPSELSRSV